MTPYWLFFLIPTIGTLLNQRVNNEVKLLGFFVFFLIAVLMIGLRYDVGGDWVAYLWYITQVENLSFFNAIKLNDPGYMAINWISVRLGFGIVGVNLICGAVMTYGIIRFCKMQPLPWLGLLITTPYLLIVVGMGYSRQAIAIGIIFLALSVWKRNNFRNYCMLVILATLFHKSAIVMLIFGVLIDTKNNFLKWVGMISIFFLAGIIFIFAYLGSASFKHYFLAPSIESGGGFIRVMMNVIPALLFFIFRNKFAQFHDYRLWKYIGILNLLFLVTVSFLSTATDRFALYLAPIQVAVFSRLPILVTDKIMRTALIILTVLFYLTVMFVWLNFGAHAKYWIPYSMVFEN